MLILGTHINNTKIACQALQDIYGINNNTALKICAKAGINPNKQLSQLKGLVVDRLVKICRQYVHKQKKRVVINNIKKLIELKHYKGVRHMFRLPVRGQRTHTNASTAKTRNKPLK